VVYILLARQNVKDIFIQYILVNALTEPMKKILFPLLIFRKAMLLFSALFFSLTVFAQPSNDNCNNAINLTSNTSCNNVQYRLRNATQSLGAGGFGCAPAGNYYDVWFSFTAVSTSHTATISNLQSNFTNPRIQLIGGTCAVPVSIACGTTTVTGAGLTIGTVYYVRVSNFGAAISANDRFDICITHPIPPPANDNCSGSVLLTSTATPTCTSVTGTLFRASNAAPTGACGGATATTTFDVWYRFVATSTTHAVTISGLGSNLAAGTTYVEMLSSSNNTCGGVLTSIGCQAVSASGGRLTNMALTIGNTYYVRLYVTTSPTAGATANWNFSMCLQGPPVNDLCANATVLTPGATCVNIAGTLDLTVAAASGNSGCMIAGNYYDVWYRFVAASTSQTITLSGVGTGITAPRIQIFTSCAAGSPFGCASATSLIQTGLTIGTTYFIRIANFNANPSGTGGVANFNICVTNNPSPPGNDNCSGAILLISGATCSNISGTLINATRSIPAVAGSCGNALAPDIWYSFVAQSAFPSINLSSIGANLQTNGRIQLLTGSCGALVPVGTCHSIPGAASTTINTVNNPGGSGLTIGQTYYIRITHNTLVAPVVAGTYTFNICITNPAPLPVTVIDYAKSYVNITDGTVGGTINPGDVLEIRATLVIRGVTTIDSLAYYDTLNAGTGFALQASTIATRTNEGKVFQSFTDASGDADAGWYSTAGAGSDTAIQINLGPTASRSARGTLSNTSRPSLFTSTCVTMATYRVIVNAAYDTKINFGGGAFTYRDPVSGAAIKIAFPNDSLMVYQSVGICPNNVAQTNILGDEFNGTFGAPAASPGSQNRGTSANTSYTYQPFNPSGPGDYFYAVPNNTAANNSIVQTLPKPGGGGARVFNVWDITGDHTGAANPARGNSPCNPALPISATNPCGYMLVVNAAYRTDVAFSFTVSGACPNTYYEISSWVKNICYKCGDDVNGRNSSDPSGPPFYIPTSAGDSSGVRPNLAYEINGVDYYTTGDIPYQGLGGTQTGSDTLNNWLQKSFVYRTGLTETSFVLTIRNNAPGGGGNDWALDDISLRTCYPNMSYSPSVNSNVCVNNPITIADTVRSYYNTYTEYKWQRSTDGGTTWVDIAGTTGTATPVLINGMYQFVTVYTIPLAFTTLANNGDQYRVVVATTVANLASTCNYSDVIPITISITQPSVNPTSVTGADICNGGSTTLTAVGATLGTSANYQWGTGAVVGTSPIVGATSSTLTVSPTTTTTYWVRIENTTAPCPATTSGLTRTITVSQPSAAPTSITGIDICNGSSTTLTALGATLGTNANYQWGTGAVVGTSPIVGATNSTLTVSPTTTTTYWVRVENTAGPCAPTTSGLTRTITVRQPSVAPSSITGADICNPGSTTLTAVGATLGTSANYQWGTGAVVGTSPIVGATSSTLTVSPITTTTYWVRVENTSSPCAATTSGLTRTITVRQPSVAPASITGADICNPGSTTLTAAGGTLGTSANYQWGTGAVVGTSPLVGQTGSTLTVSPGSTTTYWVRIENTAGPCSPTTAGITRIVTVNQPSVPPTSVTGADYCNPGSTTLTALGATLGTSANYQWGTGAVVGTSPIVGATGSTLTVSPTSTTTYWVRIENNAGPCSPTTSGLTRTITVSQPSIAATSAARNKNNICPGISVNLSVVGGTLGTSATWRWYTGACGTTLVGSGASLSVTPLVTTTYYVRAEGSCNTTSCQIVTINVSCDIDKDKDGIPDWVESNMALAFQDANSNGLINAYDPTYPGFVDNNNDFLNDNFQADGDTDNDGLPNYLDLDFAGRVDVNSDGIDDRFDMDLDGKINMIDKDSDNDGAPDVVEAYGVDTNGDGSIDNFIDADGDGLSDQVDANLVNAYNSGVGLNRPDLDGDAVPNYLDLDSDNDGIPDIVEVGAPDTNNNGMVDGFTDANNDGLHDGYINAGALLITGADGNNDGRADTWPNKNMDRDLRPNAYDMDADGDGIVDVIEAGLPDVNFDGRVDGTIAANGWSTSVSALPALNLRNTDADGKLDFLDIDADDDGIPDNIEGQTTAGYRLPTLIDADGDGLMNPYDNTPAAFGGSGILVYDHDGDNTPDYRDLDTDSDGLLDRVEGNDFNLNALPDDNVTLTGLDTDGDGLDNRFDSLNSITNIKGTSYRMGASGSFIGDATPGSRTTVQRSFTYQPDRDWRYAGYVLPVQFLSFAGTLNNNNTLLNWTIIADKEIDRFEIERSTTNSNFIKVQTVAGIAVLQTQQSFRTTDDVTSVNSEIIYYRLKVIGKDGAVKYSNVIFVRKKQTQTYVNIMPNPANSYVTISLDVDANMNATVVLIDKLGRRMLVQNEKLIKGFNTITLTLDRYSAGVYAIVIETASEKITKQLIIVR